MTALVCSHVGTERGHPQTHKVGNRKFSKMSWDVEASRLPLTGTKVLSSAPEEQPCTIIPLHQTLHSTQYNQKSTVLLANTKPRLGHQIARLNVIRYFKKHAFTALHSRAVCSDGLWRKLLISVHYAPQCPFCGWAAVVPNCFHFVLIPLTTDCRIFSSELLRVTHSFTNVAAVSMPVWLIFIQLWPRK